jgi:hypothetical protein
MSDHCGMNSWARFPSRQWWKWLVFDWWKVHCLFMKKCFGNRARYKTDDLLTNATQKYISQINNEFLINSSTAISSFYNLLSQPIIGPRYTSINLNLPIVFGDGLFLRETLAIASKLYWHEVNRFGKTVTTPSNTQCSQTCMKLCWFYGDGRCQWKPSLLPMPYLIEVTFLYSSELVRWTSSVFFSKWMQPRRPSQRKHSRTLFDFVPPFHLRGTWC